MNIAPVVKTFVLHHLAWVVLVGVGLIGIHAWIGEHDQRLLADQKVAVAEQQVKTLQTDIQANNQQIAVLQQQMEARDAAAAKQIATLTQLVSKVQTTAQAAQSLPQVANLPVAPTVAPDSSVVIPPVDVLPLFQQLAQGKEDAINLTACKADLTDEKAVVAKDDATIADMTKQIALKDEEITALKKPKSFWHRVVGTMKDVGIGIGIGFALGHKF
jgi:hypothetical protein